MTISAAERKLIDQVEIEKEAWPLIERFSTQVREHPADVDRGMDDVVERLEPRHSGHRS